MAPATERHALIVAHGAPSDPAPQEAAIRALARRVRETLPGWTIKGATLAMPGAVEAAMARLETPVIYPFFMAHGWFVDAYLSERVGPGAGARLAPLGADPALPMMVENMVWKALAARRWTAPETTLVIAAHGSPKHPESSRTAHRFAAALEPLVTPRALRVGFVDEAPRLEDVLCVQGPALCVPFFAANGGHVTRDIPNAVSKAAFRGATLPPLIHYRGLDRVIGNALVRGTRVRDAA